jgi:hypothetical protein
MAVSFSRNLDQLGMMASLACTVHCALMPLFLSTLPLFLQDERLEWLLVGATAGLGIASLTRGYKRHRKKLALSLLTLGLVLLISGRFVEEAEGTGGILLVVFGGITVAFSHFLNHRLHNARQ